MANTKQFVVIGLGRFGESVAKTLYSLGHEVLAIDMDEDSVQEIADNVTHAVQMDATDESALKTLGLRNFDVAVVTIGSNMQLMGGDGAQRNAYYNLMSAGVNFIVVNLRTMEVRFDKK